MSCTGENREEALLNCICDKIFYLHQMIEPLLNNVVTLLTSIDLTVSNIYANTNTITTLLTNTDATITHISINTDTIVNQLNDLITCCQSQNTGATRNPVIISVNSSSTPPNRITNIAGIVPGNVYMTVEFRNVGTNPVLVNGFILSAGQRRVFQVYGGDKLGPISYDCTAATGIALGGTGAGILEIEGILF
jgi:hypothetical protein